MEVTALWIISILVSLWVGSYFSPYLKKRAENLATHEDLDKLLLQIEATTAATKRIEARISNEVWNRQRQWELKREALLEGGRVLADFMAAVAKLNVALSIETRPGDEAYIAQLTNLQNEVMTVINQAEYSLKRAQLVVSVVSSAETQQAFVSLEKILKAISAKIAGGNTDIYQQMLPLVKTAASDVTHAIRRELGVDIDEVEIMPQFSESSTDQGSD